MPEKILQAWLRLTKLQKEAIASRQEDRLRRILEAKERLRLRLDKQALSADAGLRSLVEEILSVEEEARVELSRWREEIRQELATLARWREWAEDLRLTGYRGGRVER